MNYLIPFIDTFLSTPCARGSVFAAGVQAEHVTW
jgi:hypothetical protein